MRISHRLATGIRRRWLSLRLSRLDDEDAADQVFRGYLEARSAVRLPLDALRLRALRRRVEAWLDIRGMTFAGTDAALEALAGEGDEAASRVLEALVGKEASATRP